MFKGSETMFSGFNIETPMKTISLTPRISVRAKVTLTKIVELGVFLLIGAGILSLIPSGGTTVPAVATGLGIFLLPPRKN